MLTIIILFPSAQSDIVKLFAVSQQQAKILKFEKLKLSFGIFAWKCIKQNIFLSIYYSINF